jgi:hypothetical protein
MPPYGYPNQYPGATQIRVSVLLLTLAHSVYRLSKLLDCNRTGTDSLVCVWCASRCRHAGSDVTHSTTTPTPAEAPRLPTSAPDTHRRGAAFPTAATPSAPLPRPVQQPLPPCPPSTTPCSSWHASNGCELQHWSPATCTPTLWCCQWACPTWSLPCSLRRLPCSSGSSRVCAGRVRACKGSKAAAQAAAEAATTG